jgi:hypothetical protein
MFPQNKVTKIRAFALIVSRETIVTLGFADQK